MPFQVYDHHKAGDNMIQSTLSVLLLQCSSTKEK